MNPDPPPDALGALRLVEGTSAFARERRLALRLIEAVGYEAPSGWFAPLALPVAWHLVEVALVRCGDVAISRGSHNDGMHFDINVERGLEWPSVSIT